MDYKYCKIHVASSDNKAIILDLLSKELPCSKEMNRLFDENFEIYIDNNEDFDEIEQKQFPDGFLYFPFFLEIDFSDQTTKEYCISVINNILNLFWKNNHPAVAVFDFEHELSSNGGFNSKNIPWVK